MAGVQAGRLSIEIVAEIARLQQDLDRAKRAVNAASKDIASSARAANDNIAGMGRSSRLAGHHVQNLTFQLNDMVVGLASGQKPMTVFMQQGMQIGQIMQMAGVGVGGFVKELGLMLVPFTPIIAALGTMAAGLALVTHEVDQNSKMHITWRDVVLGTYDAAVASIKGSLTSALKTYGTTSGEVFKSVWDYAKTAFNAIYGIGTLVPRTIAEAWSTLPRAVGEAAVGAANAAIRAMNALMKAAVDVVNGYINKINAAMNVVNAIAGTAFGSIPTLSAPQINQIANQFAGAGVKFGAAMGKAMTDTLNRDFIGEGAAFIQPFAEARAAKRAAQVGGKAGREAGKAAGKAAGDAAGDAFAEELAKSLTKGFNDAFGQSLEMTSAMLKAAENVDYAEAMRQMGENLDKAQKPIRDAADAQAEWNDRLQETVALLGQLGGLGQTLGGIAQGLSTGDFSAIGGKTGALLNMASNIQWRDDTGQIRKLGEEFKSALHDVFGEGFGDKMLDAFQGAAIGGAVGGLFFGNNKSAQIGSAFGGGIAGAFSKGLGESITKAVGGNLGKALGGIAKGILPVIGGLLGGVIGQLFAKIPKASATIGVMNGELGVSGVTGNSNSRKAASTQGANSVIDALNQIANAFGATLGSAGVSIGMRKNSYVVDTTGSGRTKGAGVLNFGKDSEAALKAAIADAISDGVFVGLSAGVERLLKNGDVEKQLQKALSFQAVFDDLAAAQDPAKAAQDAIGKWHDSMAKIFAEAGATAEELAKLEELTGIKRADAAKAAAEALFEKERPARELNIQIMELEGKTAEALAAARQLELDGMDEALRPLMQRIYALQDEAEAAAKANAIAEQRKELETQLLEITDPVAGALVRQVDALNALDPSLRAAQQAVWDAKEAADALAETQRLAKEIADERTGLETQWLQLIGDTNALRARERDGISETNRALYDRIIAEQDRQAAEAEAARVAKEIADAAAVVAKERTGLEDRLLQLQGDTAALRARELAELDPANRALLDRIHALQDEQEAADAAAKAADELAARLAGLFDQRRGLQIALAAAYDPLAADALRRADTLAQLDPSLRHLQQQVWDAVDAQEALAKATEATARIENERAGLLMQWWQATGNTAAIRAAQLAELDASNRGLQQQIWAYQDAQAAAEAMQRARQDEIDSINRTINALGEASGKWLDMAREIREFRAGLFSGTANSGTTYAQSRSEFDRVSRMARLGDQGALNAFTGTAQTFLDAALNNASSLVEYQRAIGLVAGAADAAASGAEGVAREAQAQLATLHEQVAQLEALNLQTEASLAAQTDIAAVQTNDVVPTLERMVSEQQSARDEAEQARSEAQAFQVAAVSALNTVARLLSRWDRGDYAAVGNDSDTPLTVSSVTIANTTANPVPVDQVP